jgi:hypothetical protein
MLPTWVSEEMRTAAINDKRLNDRLQRVLSLLAERPAVSIPAACGGYAEMTAAYRFFDNEKVTFENVLEPHRHATQRRMMEQPVVVLVQDTTEIDLTRPEQQVAGVGPLDAGSRQGALLHLLHAFAGDGTPLGTVDAKAWTRPAERAVGATRRNNQRPIEEKESQRWLDALRQAQAQADDLPHTQVVMIADSEADIYELLVEAQDGACHCDWIVRAGQQRALVPSAECPEKWLRDEVLRSSIRYRHKVSVRGRKAKVVCSQRRRQQPRSSRDAELEVRAAQVTLRSPWRPDRKLPTITVRAVLAREVEPPAGEDPVEWLLLTSLPIDTVQQVREVVQSYCVRWMVEVFFRTLKSGCRVEQRRFEHIDRVLNCLAIYLIVTWRTLYVCRLSRSIPDSSCETTFEPAEWKSVYHVVRRERPPSHPPTLQEMVRMVAQLGGYVNKRRDDPPGPQTVWLGIQRMHDMAQCWEIFGPDAPSRNV